MALSDRIAVMNQGRIEQLGVPHDIYANPGTAFVASFIGDTNLLEGTVTGACGDGTCEVGVAGLDPMRLRCARTPSPATKVLVSIRPEKIAISTAQPMAMTS